MRKNGQRILSCTLLALLLVCTAFCGVCDALTPNSIVMFSDMSAHDLGFPDFIGISQKDDTVSVLSSGIIPQSSKSGAVSHATAKLFGVIPLKEIEVTTLRRTKLYPGGMPFGVKFYTKGVIVVGMSDVETESGNISPSYDGGIRIKDTITKVNGKEVNTVDEITGTISESSGAKVEFTVLRSGSEMNFTVTPQKAADGSGYKAGLWIRDSTAGIGTVTFVVPQNGMFAGLGHGICDVDTNELMPMLRATVMDVTISGINPGKVGFPGELKGYFGQSHTGSLIGNTGCGVYGTLLSIPENIPEDALEIGLRNEVSEGPAYIYCTLDNNSVEKYEIEIMKINQSSQDNKSFIIRITDPALLDKTGGIVQGMSGSPIIQKGKIIGAVTHVLINDPCKGYGIFIENMLRNMPELAK